MRPSAQKAEILAESYESGETVSIVARRHGLTPQQLFGWRRDARRRRGGVIGRARDPHQAASFDDAPKSGAERCRTSHHRRATGDFLR
jgi:transposase-like protein